MSPSASAAGGLDLLAANDPEQAQLWDRLVSRSATPDVYYRPGYVRAYELQGHGRAVAVRLIVAGGEFAFPLLLRDVPGAHERDGITPYGYGGVLSCAPGRPSLVQVAAAVSALASWCKENRIISCMLRLHPLLEQDKWLEPIAGGDLSLYAFGPTTAIPLLDWSESRMRKGRRSDLAVARRSLRLTWSSAGPPRDDAPSLAEALKLFRVLYEATMDRLGAAPFYHFSPAYYSALADGLGDQLAVALAWRDREPVGGSIFFAGREYAHYHLSATSEAGRSFKATTLLIREGVEWARRRGCRHLHLGGGAAGDDSLLEFKKGFGGDAYRYAFAGLVCDRKRYEDMVAARLRASGAPLRANFFPAYRA